jgi:hypothetical protein
MSAAYPLTHPAANGSGLGPHRKHSRQYPCPICGGTTSYCLTFDDGATQCGRIPSDHPAGIGYMHWPGGVRPTDWRERLAALPKPAPRPTLDAELMDRAYRALLAGCTLSEKHRADQQRRGLSDEQIARHGYASAPATQAQRQALAAAVAAEVGQPLAGQVPGFISKQRRLDLVCGDSELLIPIHDVQGRITGIRRRLDDPGEGNKYKWLSLNVEGSVGIDGNTVHVARPAHLRTDRVLIVEGEIKANIAADYFGCIVISVAGVNNINQVPATLAQLGTEDVEIAYDQDTNPITIKNVTTAETRLARRLIDAGYRVAQWIWKAEEAKGIDELLMAGLRPYPIPHPALASRQAEVTPAMSPDASQALAESQHLHSLIKAAQRAPNLGTERYTLTEFATLLAHHPEGEWVSTPYAKIGDQAGFDARTAERQLNKAGIRPKEGDAGILTGLIEVEVREVPERINQQTGQVTGGYKAVHARRLASLPELLRRISRAPVPASGKRNNHGGPADRGCPKCGSTKIRRTITDTKRCDGCGELVSQRTRTITSDSDGDGGDEPPPRHDDAHPLDDDAASVSSGDSTVTVYRGDKLTPTPSAADGGIRRRARDLIGERRRDAYESLVALHERTPPAAPPPDAPEPEPEPFLTLFPLPDMGCVTCGASVDQGQTHCRDCDPWTS